MTLFAGIDGGQSSTVAAIGDDAGEIARGSGPPVDLVGGSRDPARQAAAIGAALAAARDAAGIDAHAPLGALVAGISGFDAGESVAPDLSAFAGRSAVAHDATVAHAATLGGAAGIVVIAGTGSVAVGNAAPGGPLVRAGGWGFFFGDEGGALWIARAAARRAMTRYDRGERSELADRALAFFGAISLRSIQHAFAHGDLGRPALAAFAADVLASATDGDSDAIGIRERAWAELIELVRIVDGRLGAGAPRPVSYAGGLWKDAAFVDGFRDGLRRTIPAAALVAPRCDPAAGALILARRLFAEAPAS